MSHDHDAVCLCMTQHRPAPLELHSHHVIPTYLGGPDVPANRLWLCPTAHVNVHELLRLFLRFGFVMSRHACSERWEQPVSEYAWQVAQRGYLGWKATA